jgi:lipocalin-like protein
VSIQLSDAAHVKGLIMGEFTNATKAARIVACAAFAGLVSLSGVAFGQTLKEQIVGTWRQVSIYNEEGGTKRHLYGDNPVGLAVFDRSGYYISYLSKPDLPKFAGNNRQKGTDAEYRAIMQGMVADLGMIVYWSC